MKTITFFTCGGLQEPSAVGRYIPLAKELSRRGFRIQYLALHPDYASVSSKRIRHQDGFDVYYVGPMHVLKKGDKKYYFSPLKLLWVVLVSTIKMTLTALSLKSDVLYCFKPQPINGFAALVAKIIKRKPLILDCDDYEAELSRLNRFQKKIFVLFEDNLPRFADKVTFHTMFLKSRYLSLGFREDKFIFLSNGIDQERFSQIDPKRVNDLQSRFGLQGKKVVLYCGSLSLKSGHAIDLLLRAFPLIKKKVGHAALLIVGGGEDIDLLKQLLHSSVSHDVVFTGRVDPAEVPYYFKLASVTVDPVKDDLVNKGRSPLKIFESMAVGVPVVTSDIGDRAQVIEIDKAGLLVSIGDHAALAEGCIRILSDEVLVQKMSQDCLRIIKKYNWSLLAEQLLQDMPLLRSV